MVFFGKISNLEADSADISATVLTVYDTFNTHYIRTYAVILHIIGSNNQVLMTVSDAIFRFMNIF